MGASETSCALNHDSSRPTYIPKLPQELADIASQGHNWHIKHRKQKTRRPSSSRAPGSTEHQKHIYFRLSPASLHLPLEAGHAIYRDWSCLGYIGGIAIILYRICACVDVMMCTEVSIRFVVIHMETTNVSLKQLLDQISVHLVVRVHHLVFHLRFVIPTPASLWKGSLYRENFNYTQSVG
jgi:hypothetical protein